MSDQPVRVFVTHSWAEAEIVRGRLEVEGIPVQIQGDHEGPYPVGPAEVFVPPSFEARAREILAQVDEGP